MFIVYFTFGKSMVLFSNVCCIRGVGWGGGGVGGGVGVWGVWGIFWFSLNMQNEKLQVVLALPDTGKNSLTKF